MDLESSEAVCTSGMQYDTAQAEFTTTSQLYPNILISNYSTHAKYLELNSQMLSTQWLSSSLPTLTPKSACNITSLCTFKNPTLQNAQAELSHRPAMFWLATCIIHLIKQTIFGPPYITHTVKRTMLFGPLSTTALMYHTVNCFSHWLEHWYTFTVCQIWQVHATAIVVLHSLLRQLKQ